MPDQETLDHITPFAFELDTTLIGTKLASPWRRALALLIDLAIIATLAFIPFLSPLLIFVVLYYFIKINWPKVSKRNTTRWKRYGSIALIAAGAIILSTLGLLAGSSNFSTLTTGQNFDDRRMVRLTVANMERASKNCKTLECYQTTLQQAPARLLESNLSVEQARGVLQRSIPRLGLEKTLEQALLQSLLASPKLEPDFLKRITTQYPTGASLLAWLTDIFAELGIGFGWATIYFSVLTYQFKGQTLGKKLLKIRVLKLDGKALSLWESFGRYGGYGAGLATGLLGFLQIFWDPNRQAIEDKIANTVVIKII